MYDSSERIDHFQLWQDVLQVAQQLSFANGLRVSIVYFAGDNLSNNNFKTKSILDLPSGAMSSNVTVSEDTLMQYTSSLLRAASTKSFKARNGVAGKASATPKKSGKSLAKYLLIFFSKRQRKYKV